MERVKQKVAEGNDFSAIDFSEILPYNKGQIRNYMMSHFSNQTQTYYYYASPSGSRWLCPGVRRIRVWVKRDQ